MNVKILIALFAVVMLIQLSNCKPTHRFIRETNDHDASRIQRIKEFIAQIYGSSGSGSTSQSQSPSTPTHQPDSSPNNPDVSSPYKPDSSSSHQPDLLTSNVVETEAGPEAK